MKLGMGTIEPGTTDDEFYESVRKYSTDLESRKLVRVGGDGSRPVAVVGFVDTPWGFVDKIAMHVHGMVWKGRELFVQTVSAL